MNTPPPPPSLCTCFHLRRAARQVSQIYDHELAAVQLSLNEYSILRHAQRGTRLIGELADSLGMDRTTLTRNLRPLLGAGLLRESRGEDARQRVIALTARGARRLGSAQPHWQRAQQRIDASFGAAASAGLRQTLQQLDAALRRAGADA